MNFGKLTEEAGEANEPPWLLKIVSSVFYVCVRCFEREARQMYWMFWNIKLCERFLSVLKATSSSSYKTNTKFYSMLRKFKFLLPLLQAKYRENQSVSFSSTFLVRPAKEKKTGMSTTNIDAPRCLKNNKNPQTDKNLRSFLRFHLFLSKLAPYTV